MHLKIVSELLQTLKNDCAINLYAAKLFDHNLRMMYDDQNHPHTSFFTKTVKIIIVITRAM